jgi:hypothetical protein
MVQYSMYDSAYGLVESCISEYRMVQYHLFLESKAGLGA